MYITMLIPILFVLIQSSISLLTNSPIWVTSQYFQAGNEDVISELTNSSSTPQFIFNFNYAFSGIPNLGYGVKAYEGGDYFGQERFYVDRVDLTPTSFQVLVQIVGSTYIWILNVPYIAIDPLFPHRIVSFDNVPANYSDGEMTIFDTKQPTIQTYTNVINFTQQAGSLSYNSFREPLNSNKIVLFTSSFYIEGSLKDWDADPSIWNPIDLIVSNRIVSNQTYQITVSFGVEARLEKLHFSEIIFDEVDILDSLKYSLEYYTIEVPIAGGFYQLPRQFFANLIVGIVDFSSQRTRAIFDTNYEFTEMGGKFGIYFPERITNPVRNDSNATFYRIKNSVFFLKTWYCPAETSFFDQTTQLCTECPIVGCNTCESLSACRQCDPTRLFTLSNSICFVEDAKNPRAIISGCNEVTFTFQLVNSLTLLQIEAGSTFKNIEIQQLYFTESQGYFTIVGTYTENLPEDIELVLPTGQIIEFKLEAMILPVVYSEDECEGAKNAYNFFIAAEAISYAVLLLSIVGSCKIIGLQLFGLLQFSYFNLADHSFWNVHLAPLAQLSHLNGYNTQLISENSEQLPNSVSMMPRNSQFINNCNVMIFLLFGEMLLGFVLYLFSKLVLPSNKAIKKYANVLLKEGLVSFVMFNTMNIAFSAGIHWRYAQQNSVGSNVVMYLSLPALLVTVICLEAMTRKGYGEFKKKFKKVWPCYSYVCFYIIYQSALGFYMSLQNQFQEGTLIIIGFCFFYSLYFYSNTPFKQFYHNYRAGIILVSQLTILFITNYYRSMKSTTENSIKAHIHTPAFIQIGMISVSLTVSCAALIYEIYKFIKSKVKGHQSQHNKIANTTTTLPQQEKSKIPIFQSYIADEQ